MAHVHAARRLLSPLCLPQTSKTRSNAFICGFKVNRTSKCTFLLSRIQVARFSSDGRKESATTTAASDQSTITDTSHEASEKGSQSALRKEVKKFAMPFEEFVKVKRKLKARQRVAGLPFAFVGLGTSSIVSAYMFPDMFDATPENVQLIMGMDPLIFCGICGVVSCGIGYVAGSSLFGVFSRLLNKDLATKIDERERDFLQRIQSHRFADFSKFEDDYYGESIKTLSDYRQWLRTQQKKKNAAKKFIKDKEEQAS